MYNWHQWYDLNLAGAWADQIYHDLRHEDSDDGPSETERDEGGEDRERHQAAANNAQGGAG